MQTQTQSDHILDALHTGSGRVKKMQENTQAMESQYKALLQNIVDSGSMNDPATGTPWLPSQNFFDTVNKQFTTLLDELSSERDENNKLLVTAHDTLKNCNSKMEDDITRIVNNELSTVRSSRATHSDCRGGEDTNIADMETQCAKFDDLAQKCSNEQDWYAAYGDSSVSATAGNSLGEVIDQAEVCKNAVSTTEATANDCDTKQSTFKSNYCHYETRLTQDCDDHKQCYDRELLSLQGTIKSVEDLEKEQKTIYKMVKKVQCYIDRLAAASLTSMPTQADITTCSQLAPSADSLSITYPDIEPESVCQLNGKLGDDPRDHANANYKPGKSGWYDAEMVGLTAHDKLNSNCECNKACTR